MLPTIRVATFLASRSIRRGNLGIAAMTVLALVLIYVDLVFVPSLIQGAVDKVNEQLVETLTSDIQIVPAHGAHDIADVADVAAYLEEVRAVPGVLAATATYRIGSEIETADESNVWTIDAIDPATFGQVFRTARDVAEGRALAEDDTASVFLGVQIAGVDDQRLRGYAMSLKSVHAGDDVTLRLVNGQPIDAHVLGVFDTKFYISDGRAYVTRTWAEQLLPQIHDRASVIYVKTASGSDVVDVVARLSELRDGVALHTSADVGGAIKDEVETFDVINNILRTITLFVAVATVFIVTYVDLVNRRRQIGIERAIGISPVALVLSYVLKAIVYAVVGITLGAIVFLAGVDPLIDRYPFEFPSGPSTLGVRADELNRNAVILLIVATISATIPAWNSVRMRILDAIGSA